MQKLKSKYSFQDAGISGTRWSKSDELIVDFELDNGSIPTASIVFRGVKNRSALKAAIANSTLSDTSNICEIAIENKNTYIVGPYSIVCDSIYVP